MDKKDRIVFGKTEYAKLYALACHKGIGGVFNKRIVLPPLIAEKKES